MIYASSPTRKHDAILKIIEMNLKEETGWGAPNSHVLPRRSMAGRRAVSFTALIPPGKQAAPNSHVSPRRSMAGRRAASSTALGAGSKGRHSLFPRQFSLRGWRENDLGHDGIPEEISEEKETRLHDYTKSPIGVCKSPLEQYD
jgi:hypothetical protein